MSTQMLKKNLEALEESLRSLSQRLEKYFPNFSTKTNAYYYLRGLLSCVERKNSWQLAEEEGFCNPYRFQHFLGRAVWNADEVRDFHQGWVGESLGFCEGTLIVDETGFLKKGKHSAGVSRQYSGTAGRIENCQIGVFLGWATGKGQTLIDRELYLPQAWIEDELRCRTVHIPQGRSFYTKTGLAQQMIERAWQKGFKPSWVTADEVYGQSYAFRKFLEEHPQSYVLAVPKTQSICIGLNKFPAQDILPSLKKESWQKLSCGQGSKGLRLYDWALLPLNSPDPSYQRWLLLRKNLKKGEISYFLVFAPQTTSLQEMVIAAGQRWKIEECFESAKREVGLDQYEVRSFPGWYRHMTFALLALALLVITRSQLFPASVTPSSMQEFKKKRHIS